MYFFSLLYFLIPFALLVSVCASNCYLFFNYKLILFLEVKGLTWVFLFMKGVKGVGWGGYLINELPEKFYYKRFERVEDGFYLLI